MLTPFFSFRLMFWCVIDTFTHHTKKLRDYIGIQSFRCYDFPDFLGILSRLFKEMRRVEVLLLFRPDNAQKWHYRSDNIRGSDIFISLTGQTGSNSSVIDRMVQSALDSSSLQGAKQNNKPTGITPLGPTYEARYEFISVSIKTIMNARASHLFVALSLRLYWIYRRPDEENHLSDEN